MTETAEQRIRSLEQHLSSQPKSPLFAQLADYYLDAGRAKEALTLCDQGLAQYPFYTTGHLIKGKALLALNMKSEARREFEFVHDALPLNESVNRTLSQIPHGEEESFTGPSTALEPGTAQAPELMVEAAPEQQPSSPEATPDQWMSQFTEAAPQAAMAEAPVESPSAAEAAPDAFGLAPESAEAVVAPEEPAAEPLSRSEPFDQFVERKRGEFFGLENSLSLEEYLNEATAAEPESPGSEASTDMLPSPQTETESGAQEAVQDPFAALSTAAELPPETPTEETTEDPFAAIPQPSETAPGPAPDGINEDPFAQLSQVAPEADQTGSEQNPIEEIAEKLKDAKRITPIINFSEKATTSASEAETPSGSGFVTPTLAEIYAKQGWYDDAIKAYKALAHSKPLEKEKFEKRIQELEELKKQQDSVG